MPCENPKCSLYNSDTSIRSELDTSKEIYLCEFLSCRKRFCSHTCLYAHFLDQHNFDNNKKFFNYSELSCWLKKLLKKSIENSICGSFLEESLTDYKKKIAAQLNHFPSAKNISCLKFEEIEHDYSNLEYFYYFNFKHFDNINPNSSGSSNSKSNMPATDFKNNSIKSQNFGSASNHFNKVLGSGAFGDVYLVRNILDGKLFAIKQLNKDKVKENGIDEGIVYREINTHFRLVHNNIARLYDYYEDKKAFYLIMEYVENGTLFNKIQKSNGLSEEKALKYFVQVSSAIFFLHENQLIHRDIKPENCLIDKNDNIKLCDFGWTVEASKGERITFCGTYEYMAPEIIKEVPYNHMIDVWSLGILLYELIHSFSPFRVSKIFQLIYKYIFILIILLRAILMFIFIL